MSSGNEARPKMPAAAPCSQTAAGRIDERHGSLRKTPARHFPPRHRQNPAWRAMAGKSSLCWPSLAGCAATYRGLSKITALRSTRPARRVRFEFRIRLQTKWFTSEWQG